MQKEAIKKEQDCQKDLVERCLKNRANVLIGVLAFQGGFGLHFSHLQKLGVDALLVKDKEDLSRCDGLILPGGESTTIHRFLEESSLRAPLLAFAEKKPLFGTCAGLIIMAKENIIPLSVKRNAYGRQSASFFTHLTASFPEGEKTIEAIFIRAPRIENISPEIRVLASYQNEPVLVQYKHHLGGSFHPELTQDLSTHHFFVNLCITSKLL